MYKSLFSFFKKPSKSSDGGSAPRATPQKAVKSGINETQAKKAPGGTPSATGKAVSKLESGKAAEYGASVVGRRVRIWWPKMKTFYAALIKKFDGARDEHYIRYDDGEEEWITLAQERFELEGTPAAATPAKGAAPPGPSSLSIPGGSAGGSAEQKRKASGQAKSPARSSSSSGAAYPPMEAGEDEDAALQGVTFDEETDEDEDEQEKAAARRSRLKKKSASKAKGSIGKKRSRAAVQDSDDEYSAGEPSDEDEDDDEEFEANVGAASEEEEEAGPGSEDEDEYDDMVVAPPKKKKARKTPAKARSPRSPASSASSAVAAASARKSSAYGDRDYAVDPVDSLAGAVGWERRSGGGVLHGASGAMASAGGSAASSSSSSSFAASAGSGSWSTPVAVPDTPAKRPLPVGFTEKEMDKMVLGLGQHHHNRYGFLWQPNRKDGHRRAPSHPDYDPNTLYVPPDFLKSQTPAMRQWWEIKSRYMDTVLCFKVGKFYECFHTDADVLVKECDCIYMKGLKAHAGFPEIAYGRMSEALVARGYKVARVEQTETPAQLAQRKKETPRGQKKPQVVRRELCGLKSKGTRVTGPMDVVEDGPGGGSSPGATAALARAREAAGAALPSDAAVLLGIFETPLQAGEAGAATQGTNARSRGPNDPDVRIGACMVDAASGQVWLSEFLDNSQRTRLRTLAARAQVVELLTCDGNLTEPSARFLRFDCATAVRTQLKPGNQFWGGAKAAKELETALYFAEAPGAAAGGDGDSAATGSWPAVLRSCADLAKAAGYTPNQSAGSDDAVCADVAPGAGAFAAFAGTLGYLRRCLIDHSVLSMGRVSAYMHEAEVSAGGAASGAGASPSAAAASSSSEAASGDADAVSAAATAASLRLDPPGPRMVMDGSTLVNLEVLANSFDGSAKGSLLECVDSCVTSAGRRRLRKWMCQPLREAVDIERRLDAVDDLMSPELAEAVGQARNTLRQVPDLERLLHRIHASGSKHLSQHHPDSRAILYEAQTYSKRRIKDLTAAIRGFKALNEVRQVFRAGAGDAASGLLLEIKSTLLRDVLGEAMPDVSEQLDTFERSFNAKQAEKTGRIEPRKGFDPEYDAAEASKAEVLRKLSEYLQECKDLLRCSTLKFWGNNKDRYQIEVPENKCSAVPDDWLVKSYRKGTCRRYWTPEGQELLAELVKAEEASQLAVNDSMRRVFARFDAHRAKWTATAEAAAVLDALCSLAIWSSQGDGAGAMCRPVFVDRVDVAAAGAGAYAKKASTTAFLQLRSARHPAVTRAMNQRGDASSYVPNDVTVGRYTPTGGSGSASSSSGAVGGEIGPGGPECVLITGANMGGKSTYLRQTCACVILAQLGAYVPAESCKLSPVDRVFTRVGASDRILAGQSTFFVELAETSTILSQATTDSLVILDELGRGTSTFDGNAIAGAVTEHLTRKVGARTLFATHYHTLTEQFAADPRVQLGHMAVLVGEDDDEDEDEEGESGASKKAGGSVPMEDGDGQDGESGAASSVSASSSAASGLMGRRAPSVTFLYRFASGACPKSHGLNVARLARLPEKVLERAAARAETFELALEGAIRAAKGEAAAAAARAVGTAEDTRCVHSSAMELARSALAAVAKSASGELPAAGEAEVALAKVPDEALMRILKAMKE